jgi:hypothetical protein
MTSLYIYEIKFHHKVVKMKMDIDTENRRVQSVMYILFKLFN